jgi:alanine dehydrogenase
MIGADNPEKHEITPSLMGRARILVDDLEACAAGGDLNHSLRSGAVSKDRDADLAELASGRKQGRLTADELVIFDSSGSGCRT